MEKIVWPCEYIESKYSYWHDCLIEKAKNRILADDIYTESHHIIPKSFGGPDTKDNLVKLTAREHYLIHLLLWKMKFSGMYGSKMSYAFNTFINKMKTKNHENYKINSRIYESFRIQFAEMLSIKNKGEGNHFYGKRHSDETKKIIGEKSKLKVFKTGPENPRFGKIPNISEEGKNRRIAAVKKRWEDPVFREEMILRRKVYNQTPEGIAQRKATGDRTRGVKRDPEIMEKCASTKRGKTWEEIYSPETIAKMTLAIQTRVISDESKEKIKEGREKAGKIVECPYCEKKGARNIMLRWHFDNCKNKDK